MRITAEDIRNYHGGHLGGIDYKSLDDFYNFCLIPNMITERDDNLLFYTPVLEERLSKFGENINELINFLIERGFKVETDYNSLKILWKEN